MKSADNICILSKEKVLNEFENVSIGENEEFLLYIHSPFCVNQCSFCKHKGLPIKTYAKEYRKYYESYLPNLIDFYRPVLEQHLPDSVYFGGGSSSIMTVKDMKNIFDKIPNFKEIPDKTFECDINLLTEEKVQLLIDYKFTRVSFGVQTFDENILKKNNRPVQDINKIKETVDMFKKNNMIVNCDLMTLIDKENESDFNQSIMDIRKMAKIIEPDQIYLYPNSFAIDEFVKKDKKEAVALIKKLQKIILKNIPSFNNYCLSDDNFYVIRNNATERFLYINYKFYKVGSNEEEYDKSYKANSYPEHSKRKILLALGSYRDRQSYSHIRKDLYVLETNPNNNLDDLFYECCF